MLLYLIRCASSIKDLAYQLSTLSHPNNIFLISVDQSVDTKHADLPGSLRDHVHFFVSGPTTWGTETFLLSVLDGVREALTKWKQWEYLIPLSDSCVGLRPQVELYEYLLQRRAAGVRSFVCATAAIPFGTVPDVEYSGNLESVLGTRPSVRLKTDVSSRAYFTCNDVSPIMKLALRPSFHLSEGENGVIVCRPLFGVEVENRRRLFQEWPLRFGSFFSVLARDACSWLIYSEAASSFLYFCKNVMFPEECFFASALYRPGIGVEPGSFHNGNLHFRGAGCDFVSDDWLDDIMRSDAFFARKFVGSKAPKIKSFLDTRHGSVQPV